MIELELNSAIVESLRDCHDANKQDHPYDRCELCHYTRHPCDTYDLAVDWLTMHDALGKRGLI